MGQKATKYDFHILKDVKANVVMIGVRKSGLTSIIGKIIPDEVCGSSSGNAVSTMTPCKGVNLISWGIGFGNERPPLWKYHLKNADGLMLVVDSANSRTLVAMKDELRAIIDSQVITSSKLPVVILANKCDLANAKPAGDIADALELYDYSITWSVQSCSALTGEGLSDGVRKLFELVRVRKCNTLPRRSIRQAYGSEPIQCKKLSIISRMRQSH